MKILHLFPYLPTPATFGGALRIYHILKHLTCRYDVTVSGYCEIGNMEQFCSSFPELRGKMHFLRRTRIGTHRMLQLYALLSGRSYWYTWSRSEKLERNLNRLLSKEGYDVVLSEFPTTAHFDLETDAVRILDAHNVEHDNFRRMSQVEWSFLRKAFYTREYRKSCREEIGIFRKQDAIFTTSARDGEMIGKEVPEKKRFVIPNGVDTRYFSPRQSVIEPWSMVFTGAMSYIPNRDGMLWFLQEVFPLIQKRIPRARIYIVGGKPPPILTRQQSESVIVTGYVDDVRPFIGKAALYVVPLRMGSGTRLKVLEALSMQKPIVSTRIGCEGIDVEDGRHLLVRDRPEAFADAVVELMEDRLLQLKLISEGSELVRSRYDWKVIGGQIDRALESLTGKTVRTPRNGRVGAGFGSVVSK